MSFFKIQAARLAAAMAQGREQALIDRVGEVMGIVVTREEVAQLAKCGRLSTVSRHAAKQTTYFLDRKAILLVGEPKIEFTGAEISATQEIRRL
jgi:hypothetical protein